MKSGIYQICINDKIYIGSATNIYNRKHRHLHDLKKNKHCNKKLQNYFNKYGEENFIFDVIEYCNIEVLIEREQYYLDSINPFLNICKIAGNSKGFRHSEETKKNLSKNRKGKSNSLGRVLSDDTKKLISIKAKQRGLHKNFILASLKANTGRKHSKENIEKRISKQVKISESQVKEIRELLNNNMRQIDIAKIYSVSQRVISRIKNKVGYYGNI
jgi:group I intron endonuclease